MEGKGELLLRPISLSQTLNNCLEVVGLSTRKHKDWFDEADKEIQELLEKKRSCHNPLLAKPDDQAAKAAYKTACSTLQAKLRTMQND